MVTAERLVAELSTSVHSTYLNRLLTTARLTLSDGLTASSEIHDELKELSRRPRRELLMHPLKQQPRELQSVDAAEKDPPGRTEQGGRQRERTSSKQRHLPAPHP
jgi:hypothetical protein